MDITDPQKKGRRTQQFPRAIKVEYDLLRNMISVVKLASFDCYPIRGVDSSNAE